MSEHGVTVEWQRNQGEAFVDHQYSRAHLWKFDGGTEVAASPSPLVVPVPLSVEQYVDPEEAFIASLSSCHMLVFLSIAAKKNYLIDRYTDNAIGTLGKNTQGRIAVTKVILRPNTQFIGERIPSREQLEKMHHLAHEHCFIANSVNTKVITEIGENN